MKNVIAGLAFAISLLTAGTAAGRTFTDAKGREIEAEILSVDGDEVTIRKEDGKEFTIAVALLSDADREFIRGWTPPPKVHTPKVSAHGISDAHGQAEYKSGVDTFDGGKFWVYVPESYHADTPMPLVVSSHGNSKKAEHPGEAQVRGWTKLADEHGFIVACPSYGIACSQGEDYHGGDTEKRLSTFRELVETMMPMLFESFNIDRRAVLATGMSGGGHPTWMSMDYPDYFSALAFRCANFSDYYTGRLEKKNLRKWEGRPAYYYNGADDKLVEGEEVENARAFLKEHVGGDRLKMEELPGVAHQSLNPKVAEWFVAEVVKNVGDAPSE